MIRALSVKFRFASKILPVIFFLSFQAGVAQDTLDLFPPEKGSLVCWHETRTLPRPLRIHYLRLNLACHNLELFTMPGKDPDGDGPAESTLTPPEELFTQLKALAAVNANAFAGLPGTENDIRGWYRDRPVDMHGLVVSGGIQLSPPENGRMAFWIDPERKPHIGTPKPDQSVWQAIADWSGPLLIDNRVIPLPAVTTLHPRTALGFDDTGQWLLIVVADGRQPGTSEGFSLHELAVLFQSKGCTQAMNLDGGGSSIMLIRKPGGAVETVNRPSGLMRRPVPVMLGIRETTRPNPTSPGIQKP